MQELFMRHLVLVAIPGSFHLSKYFLFKIEVTEISSLVTGKVSRSLDVSKMKFGQFDLNATT